MTSAASDDVFVAGLRESDRRGHVIRAPSRICDQMRSHGTTRSLLIAVRRGCILDALLVVAGRIGREYLATEPRDRRSTRSSCHDRSTPGNASTGRGLLVDTRVHLRTRSDESQKLVDLHL